MDRTNWIRRHSSVVMLLAALLLIATAASPITPSIALASELPPPAVRSINVYYAPMSYHFDDGQFAPPADQRGFLYNQRVYLPLRFVAYSLNQSVDWDSSTYTVTVSTPSLAEQGRIEDFKADNRVTDPAAPSSDASGTEPVTVRAYILDVTYILFGETVKAPEGMEAIMVNNRLFVPLRFLSDSLSYHIEWDNATKSVAVSQADRAGNGDSSSEEDGEETPDLTDAAGDPVPFPAWPVPAPGGPPSEPAKPSRESLINDAEKEIQTLRNSCQSKLLALWLQYDSSMPDEEKEDLKRRGEAEVASCDDRFEDIMDRLSDNLSRNGYSTDVIADYRKDYEQIKKAAREALGL